MTAAERSERDELICRLRTEGRSAKAIAAAVGVSKTTAWEVGWGWREQRNRRRRAYWRKRAAREQSVA
jgi:hypothetical protein